MSLKKFLLSKIENLEDRILKKIEKKINKEKSLKKENKNNKV